MSSEMNQTGVLHLMDQQHVVIISSPALDEIDKNISQGKRFIFDDEKGYYFPVFEQIISERKSFDFIICLKNKNFYQLDVIAVLENFFKGTAYHPLLIEQMITAAQEAFSNAFMWSSLDLHSYKNIRPYEFFQTIEDRLRDPFYADRSMLIYLAQTPSQIEIAIFIQGHPIVWPKEGQTDKFRGISIIKTFCSCVFIEEDGKGIRLFFKI